MNTTKNGTVLKLASTVAGLVIVETALILGTDSAAMLIGGTLLGVPIGAAAMGGAVMRAVARTRK